MRFNFNEDHLMFQESLRGFLANECGVEQLRTLWESDSGRSDKRWKGLAELGVLGMLAPESAGGLGMNEIDLVLLLEEAGRAGLPEPIVESAAVVAPLLRDIDGDDETGAWLAKITTGDATASVAHPMNPCVTDAHIADFVVVLNDTVIELVQRDQYKEIKQPSLDRARKLFTIDWTGNPAKRLAEGARAEELTDAAFDRAALGTAAQLVGMSQQLVDLAVEYAGERQQFGRPIGSFQAIKHHLASVQVKIEFARPLLYRAAHSVAHTSDTRSVDVSAAKSAAGDAATAAAKTALQCHGAIGYTWEVDLHVWMKRAWALEKTWGSSAWHRKRIGDSVLGDDNPVSFGFSPRF